MRFGVSRGLMFYNLMNFEHILRFNLLLLEIKTVQRVSLHKHKIQSHCTLKAQQYAYGVEQLHQ